MPDATSNQYGISSAVMIYLHYLFSSKNTKTGNLSPKYLISVNVELVFYSCHSYARGAKVLNKSALAAVCPNFVVR
jgi:hypothetical protein